MPPLLDYLGEFTSKLKPGDQDPIIIGTESKTVQSIARYAVLPCRQEQLNFDLLKQNFIDKVTKPTEQLRETQVYNPHKIKQETNTKTLKTIKETKRYKVIFDKRIANPDTFKLYPYGYKKQPTLLDEDLSQAQDAQMPSSMMWT